jgi:hypothetical protein
LRVWSDELGYDSIGSGGRERKRTVDSDGNALGESISVLAKEGRNLSKFAGLEMFGRRLGGVSLNNLDLEIVCLRNCQNGSSAGVGLGVTRRLVSGY